MPDRMRAPTKGFASANQLLEALPTGELSSLEPFLEVVPLGSGRTLLDIDEPLTRVYFVEAGVASLLSAFENRSVGVAAVGSEGAVDLATLVLGGNTALGRAVVLVPGSALAMEVSAFRRAVRENPNLCAACKVYARALLVQMLQAVPCNRLHTVEQRCARWLLMCADRTKGNEFELAPKCLADLLGVSQSTLVDVIEGLHERRLIGWHRGSITVVDRPGLEAAACECYRIVRDRDDRLPSYRPD